MLPLWAWALGALAMLPWSVTSWRRRGWRRLPLAILILGLSLQGVLAFGRWRVERNFAADGGAARVIAGLEKAAARIQALDRRAQNRHAELIRDPRLGAALADAERSDARLALFRILRGTRGQSVATEPALAIMDSAGRTLAYDNERWLPSELPLSAGARAAESAVRVLVVHDFPLKSGYWLRTADPLLYRIADFPGAAGVGNPDPLWIEALEWSSPRRSPRAGKRRERFDHRVVIAGVELGTLSAWVRPRAVVCERLRARDGNAGCLTLAFATALLAAAMLFHAVWPPNPCPARGGMLTRVAPAIIAIVWVRVLLLGLNPQGLPPPLREIFGFEQFASRFLGPFSRSAGDLLLTGVTALALAVAAWLAARGRADSGGLEFADSKSMNLKRRIPRLWMWTIWTCAVVGATLFVDRLSRNVAANALFEPVLAQVLPVEPAPLCVALGILFVALALTIALILTAPVCAQLGARGASSASSPLRRRWPSRSLGLLSGLVSPGLFALAVGIAAAGTWEAREWPFFLAMHAAVWGGLVLLARAASQPARPAREMALMSAVAVLAVFAPLENGITSAHRQLIAENLVPYFTSGERQRASILAEELGTFFSDLDLEDRLPGFSTRGASPDLAFYLWSLSSLSARNEPASLSVVRADGMLQSVFANGVPLFVDLPAAASDEKRHEHVNFAGKIEELVHSEFPLTVAGRHWGRVIVHVYGASLAPPVSGRGGYEDLLVLGHREAPPEYAGSGIELAVYHRDGQPAAPRPQPEVALPREIADHVRLHGAGWFHSRAAAPGAPRRHSYVFERGDRLLALSYASSSFSAVILGMLRLFLLLAVALACLALPFALLRGGARFWRALSPRRLFGSYQRKVMGLYAAVLIVPFVSLTLAGRAYFIERLRDETLRRGRLAASVTRHVLEDYLQAVSVGDAPLVLDDELVSWLAQVVGYDVNIYRGSELVSANRRELFASGLLPLHLAATSFLQLNLLERNDTLHRRRLGSADYYEISAPLAVGESAAKEPLPPDRRWTLTVPLVFEQRAVEEEIARLTDGALLIGALVLFVAVGLGHQLSRRVIRPLAQLTAGTEAVARGDFSVDLQEPGETELRVLFDAFRQMSARIAEKQLALTAEKELVQNILTNVSAGIFTFDAGDAVVTANPVAEALLPGLRTGVRWSAVPALAEAEAIVRLLRGFGPRSAEVVVQRAGLPRTLRVVAVPLAESAGLTVALIEDLTEIAASHRLRAWAEMARRIAHEIKNPLTPIQLSAEHLRAMHERGAPGLGEIIESATATILKQVEQLRSTAVEFGDYARIPGLTLRRVNLGLLLEEIVAPYREPLAERIPVTLAGADSGTTVVADSKLLRRALVNVIENALHAMPAKGALDVTLQLSGSIARIQIADRGPGVEEEQLDRIFEPAFSTKTHGTGLGLALTRRAIEEHGGSVTARNRPGGGLEVTIDLPVAPVRPRGEAGASPLD